MRMLDTLDVMRLHLGVQHLMHLRFELYHADGVADALAWMDAGRVHSLSFNDHLPMMHDKLDDVRELAQYTDRAECDIDIFLARSNATTADMTRLNEVTGTLAQAA